MSKFGERLREERKRLGLNQAEFGVLGGVTNYSQLAYEKGTRRPDTEYLECIAEHGVDVAFLLTGVRLAAASERPVNSTDPIVPVVRELTPEQAALLDNYENADAEGRDAARRVLVALAKSKAAKKAA